MRSSSSWYETSKTLWVLLAAVLLGSGCGDVSRDGQRPGLRNLPSETARQAIKNGTVDSENKAVVGMAVQRNRGFGICTGTLIAKNLVLTAQHCVSELSGGRGIRCDSTTFTKTLGPDALNVTTATRVSGRAKFYSVEKIIAPEGNEVCGEDIALLRLSSNVPSREAEPRTPKLGKSVKGGKNYTAMGYGTTGENESGRAGVRRRLEGRTVQCVGEDCFGGYVERGEFVGSGGTCQGDSGGGAYESSGQVFGVLSRGGGNCDSALYTGVKAWEDLIRQTAQKAASKGNYSPPAWASAGPDKDGDGLGAQYDNCPKTKNPDQKDTDEDGKGDACDPDDDGDGVKDDKDNCGLTPNPEQGDVDGDGKGNPCDDDMDGDGIPNESDVCPTLANPDQKHSGEDGSCKDSDGDRVADVADNCKNTRNFDQIDQDNDGKGAVCDSDEAAPESGSEGGGDTGPAPVYKADNKNKGSCSATGSGRPGRVLGFGAFLALFAIGRALRRRG